MFETVRSLARGNNELLSTEALQSIGVPQDSIQIMLKRNQLIRIRRGFYSIAQNWKKADSEQQHLLRIRAAQQAVGRPLLFSHRSAATVHGLPLVGPADAKLHVLDPRATGTGNFTGIHIHRDPEDPHPVMLSGLCATSLARTLVDVARTHPLIHSIPVIDAALRREAAKIQENQQAALEIKNRMFEVLDLLGPRKRGKPRAQFALDESTWLSDSVGESMSRIRIQQLGFAPPILQQKFAGLPYRVDFWWPGAGVIGEFDGATKYLSRENMAGLSAEEIVYREKLREDELRKHCRNFIRWDMKTAASDHAFIRLLNWAGVPRA